MPFPDTNQVLGTGGRQGLLITDVHDDEAHVIALTRNLGVLYRAGVRVLFLEHFSHLRRNLHIEWFHMTTDPVPAMIQENHFNWYVSIADNMRRLLMTAYALGMQVHGLNVPGPPNVPHFVWRMGESNVEMAKVVKECLNTNARDGAFAVFIGKDHARGLRKLGRLSNIKAYSWNGAAYDEV